MGIRALGLCAALGLASFTAFADYSSATKDLKMKITLLRLTNLNS